MCVHKSIKLSAHYSLLNVIIIRNINIHHPIISQKEAIFIRILIFEHIVVWIVY